MHPRNAQIRHVEGMDAAMWASAAAIWAGVAHHVMCRQCVLRGATLQEALARVGSVSAMKDGVEPPVQIASAFTLVGGMALA